MATDNQVLDLSFKAAADLSAKQYYGVKVTANFRVNVAGAYGTSLIGVLQDAPSAAGDPASIFVGPGLCPAIAGAAFAVGSKLTTNASGKFISTTTANDTVIGYAVEAAGADGDIVTILVSGRPDLNQGRV